MANSTYRLRCQLYGHEADVRSVSTITEFDGIVSGSRDKTARIWRPSDKTSFEERAVLKNHTNFVATTCYIPPSDRFTDGLIVTGSNDKTICVYAAKQAKHLFTLSGHEQTVACLSHVPQSDILLSGSWDNTGRIWSLSTQQCLHTLKGHSKALWAVISMGDVTNDTAVIVTGSADHLVMAWKNQVVVQTYQGHTDCVRSLAVLNSHEFLSCANDGSIRRWNLDSPHCLQSYEGHSSFVYSLTVISPERFASSSEDRSLRLWSIDKSEPKQTIRLPAQSLWSTCSLSNGDVVVGCSDGRIFVFTTDESRTATAEEISAFETELASSSIQTKTGDLGEVKINDLPNADALSKPGTRDGQTTMINLGDGHVEAYQWSMESQRWMKIGDVVGSADSTAQGQASATGEKIMFEGKFYDYVFNVDVGDEHIPKKLPYNLSEDPWFAAQAFIHRHELSQMFLDQIAQFILTNTKGMVIDQRAADYTDPFTGGGRYVPGSGPSTGSAVQARNQDPFTGAGRYIPNGGGSDQPSSRPPSASQTSVLKSDKDVDPTSTFPQTHYITIGSADTNKILSKLKDFNENATGDGIRLNDIQFQQINELANGNFDNLPEKITLMYQLLKWPSDKVFPILDIFRLIILNPNVCKYILENEIKTNEFFSHLFNFLQSDQTANVMLIFRTLTNLFSNQIGENVMIKNNNSILAKTLICLPLAKKNTQIAVTSVFLNYCIYAYRINDERLSNYLYECYQEFVDIQFESEGAKRLLLGLGTLFYINADLVINARTIQDNSAQRFFNSLEKSATSLNGDTLECFERCRALVKTL